MPSFAGIFLAVSLPMWLLIWLIMKPKAEDSAADDSKSGTSAKGGNSGGADVTLMALTTSSGRDRSRTDSRLIKAEPPRTEADRSLIKRDGEADKKLPGEAIEKLPGADDKAADEDDDSSVLRTAPPREPLGSYFSLRMIITFLSIIFYVYPAVTGEN